MSGFIIEKDRPVLQGLTNTSPLLGVNLLNEPTGLGEFEELCWQYLHKLPGNLVLGHITTRVETEAGAFASHRYEFDCRLFLTQGELVGAPVGQLAVTLYRKPGGAEEDIFLELEQCQLWYPELRGQGLGKALVERVKHLGEALDVKALTAIAIYDGRFVWPALGFRFGDYLPSEQAAKKFQKRFRLFCQRHKTTPPDTTGWDAPQFATFLNGLQVPAPVGHSMDREQKAVHFGRAFLLTRRPFFLTFPLSKGQI
jgi:GNAT superfamily N-acetyltransferase